MKTCPACLETFDDDVNFCPKDGTPLETQEVTGDPLLGRTLANRYLVLDKLGEGGFGTVYRVRDTRLDDVEALKVLDSRRLPSDRGAEVSERFMREAKVLRRLGKRSKHIIGATNLFHDEDENLFCYAMEYVEGENLAQMVGRDGPMEPLRAIGLVRQLCAALEVAHAESIVHRDLKLENLMITRTEEGELLRVLDFGIAKVLTQGSLTDLNVGVPGTPGFTAPEQLENPKEVGPRADLFPVGVILFSLLTAHDPWKGRPVSETPTDSWTLVRATMMGDPKALKEFRSDVPKDLVAVVTKLLQKKPDDRFQSATELDEALAAVEQRLQKGRGIPPLVWKALPVAAAAVLAFLGWSFFFSTPALSLDEFFQHVEDQDVEYVEVRGGQLRVGLEGPEGSSEFHVPMRGEGLQDVMGRVAEADVTVRGFGEGSVRVEAVESDSGTEVEDPVLSLESDEAEGCEPCSMDDASSLASGWYQVSSAGDAWRLDSLEVEINKGYQSESVPVTRNSRVFIPGRARVSLRAMVSLTAAGRRARAEAQRRAEAESRAEGSDQASQAAASPSTSSSGGGGPLGLTAADLADQVEAYVGSVVQVTDAHIARRLGSRTFVLELPGPPILLKLDSSLTPDGLGVPAGAVTVTGTIAEVSGAVLDSWVSQGILDSDERAAAGAATHYLDGRGRVR